jgi:hypothetical protein
MALARQPALTDAEVLEMGPSLVCYLEYIERWDIGGYWEELYRLHVAKDTHAPAPPEFTRTMYDSCVCRGGAGLLVPVHVQPAAGGRKAAGGGAVAGKGADGRGGGATVQRGGGAGEGQAKRPRHQRGEADWGEKRPYTPNPSPPPSPPASHSSQPPPPPPQVVGGAARGGGYRGGAPAAGEGGRMGGAAVERGEDEKESEEEEVCLSVLACTN